MGQLKDPPKVKPIVDGITGILVLSMVAGLPLVGWLYHRGVLPFWITIVFGTLLMNLSFTAWHETSRQNLSKFNEIILYTGEELCYSFLKGFFQSK